MMTIQLDNALLLVQIDGAPTSVFLQCVPAAQSQVAWDGSAPSAVLEVLPAGHAPGVYHVSAPVLVKATTGAGIIDRTITFSAPGLGPTSHVNAAPSSLAVPGLISAELVAIVSDGVDAVTVSYNPSGVAQPAEMDWYAAASLAGRLS
jgi:hypothetical protein